MVKTCSDNFPTIGQNKCQTSAVKIRNYSYSYNLFGHCPAHQVVFFLVSCNLNALREVCMEVSKSSISQSAFLWRYRCLSRSRGRLATTLSKCISISEYDSTELVLYRSVESFTDAVCQWTLCLDLEVVDVLNGHI